MCLHAGYNLFLSAPNQSHISLTDKYDVRENKYNQTYDFRSIKIRRDGRFMGLVIDGDKTAIALGSDNETTGVTIERYIHVEDIPNLHCFDVEEIVTQRTSYGIVDCAVFKEGMVSYNEFLYVNLTSGQIDKGSKITDTFVKYTHLSKRRVEVVQWPLPYLIRFTFMDGVGQEHTSDTYVEIFLMDDPLNPQLLDVLDHTFFNLDSLSIADHAVHGLYIYILVYNVGLYEIELHPNQYIEIRSMLPIQLDAAKFHVTQLGFNDDLLVAIANEHTIYQYEWDMRNPATLVAKYSLLPETRVKQLLVGPTFVIAVTESIINAILLRRTCIFTRRTLSYLNAYNCFNSELEGPHIVHYDSYTKHLQIFDLNSNFFIKLSLPYLHIKDLDKSMVGKTESIVVKAVSVGDRDENVTCNATFTFTYLEAGDSSIMQTKFWPFRTIVADSPDEEEFPLNTEYFGANLTYDIDFETSNSSQQPTAYINKQH